MTDRPAAPATPREAPPASLPSIRPYLATLIVGTVVFCFAVFSAAAYFIVVRPAQDELARVEMTRAAAEVESDIRGLIDQVERLLSTARDWGYSGLIRIGVPDDFSNLMIPVLRNRPQVSAVLLANERGQAVLFGHGEAGGWLARVIDYEKLGARQHWTRLAADGSRASDEWIESDFDPRRRTWYQGALALAQEDAIHWTEPHQFFTSKEPGISASMRWTDRDTGLRHVIAIDMLLLDLSRVTARVAVGKSGRAAILTQEGKLLGLPRHPLVKTDDDLKQRVLKTPREAGFMMLAGAYEQWTAAGRPEAQAGFFEAEGETWIGRFRPFRLGDRRLLIATVAPRSDFALGSIREALAIGAVMAMVLLLAFLAGRRFSRR